MTYSILGAVGFGSTLFVQAYNLCLNSLYKHGTQQAHDVETMSTLIQRQDVESTLFQHCMPAGYIMNYPS